MASHLRMAYPRARQYVPIITTINQTRQAQTFSVQDRVPIGNRPCGPSPAYMALTAHGHTNPPRCGTGATLRAAAPRRGLRRTDALAPIDSTADFSPSRSNHVRHGNSLRHQRTAGSRPTEIAAVKRP